MLRPGGMFFAFEIRDGWLHACGAHSQHICSGFAGFGVCAADGCGIFAHRRGYRADRVPCLRVACRGSVRSTAFAISRSSSDVQSLDERRVDAGELCSLASMDERIPAAREVSSRSAAQSDSLAVWSDAAESARLLHRDGAEVWRRFRNAHRQISVRCSSIIPTSSKMCWSTTRAISQRPHPAGQQISFRRRAADQRRRFLAAAAAAFAAGISSRANQRVRRDDGGVRRADDRDVAQRRRARHPRRDDATGAAHRGQNAV